MRTPRLLIVDDEDSVRRALVRWFENCGFAVDIAEDGQRAVEKCEINQYDAVTMDLEMPRMNGRDAIVAIKRIHPKLPIIVLTGYSPDPDGTASNGAEIVLHKPISLRELESEVRRIIGQGSSSGPASSAPPVSSS